MLLEIKSALRQNSIFFCAIGWETNTKTGKNTGQLIATRLEIRFSGKKKGLFRIFR